MVVMRRHDVVLVLPAVFVHAAGISLVGAIGVAPHTATIMGVGSPMRTELTTDPVELGRQRAVDVRRPRGSAVRRIGAACSAHSVHELAVPRAKQRFLTHVVPVVGARRAWIRRISCCGTARRIT